MGLDKESREHLVAFATMLGDDPKLNSELNKVLFSDSETKTGIIINKQFLDSLYERKRTVLNRIEVDAQVNDFKSDSEAFKHNIRIASAESTISLIDDVISDYLNV